MHLSQAQKKLLTDLQHGSQLKIVRTADGAKQYRLFTPDASSAATVAAAVVAPMERTGLLASNMKFPAAAMLLTDKGAAAAAAISGQPVAFTGPRKFEGGARGE